MPLTVLLEDNFTGSAGISVAGRTADTVGVWATAAEGAVSMELSGIGTAVTPDGEAWSNNWTYQSGDFASFAITATVVNVDIDSMDSGLVIADLYCWTYDSTTSKGAAAGTMDVRIEGPGSGNNDIVNMAVPSGTFEMKLEVDVPGGTASISVNGSVALSLSGLPPADTLTDTYLSYYTDAASTQVALDSFKVETSGEGGGGGDGGDGGPLFWTNFVGTHETP